MPEVRKCNAIAGETEAKEVMNTLIFKEDEKGLNVNRDEETARLWVVQQLECNLVPVSVVNAIDDVCPPCMDMLESQYVVNRGIEPESHGSLTREAAFESHSLVNSDDVFELESLENRDGVFEAHALANVGGFVLNSFTSGDGSFESCSLVNEDSGPESVDEGYCKKLGENQGEEGGKGDEEILNVPLGLALENEQKFEVGVLKKMLYYLVKLPRPVDNSIWTRVRLAELQLNEKTERCNFIKAALQMKRSSRSELLDRLRRAKNEERACRDAIRCKRQEMDPVHFTLIKMKNASSVEELDENILYMEYQIEHESMPLREEKKLLREIKQLKLSREQLCATAGPHAELREAFDQREKIEEQCKLLGQQLDDLKKQLFQAEKGTQSIQKDFVALDDALKQLQAQWNNANDIRQEAYEALKALKRQDYERNVEFYQNKSDIQAAKQYASARDRELLEEHCMNQVEGILNLWNKNKEFRKNYMEYNHRSTLRQLETLDGRSLGLDEEPPLPMYYIDDSKTLPDPKQGKALPSSAKPRGDEGSMTAVQQSSGVDSRQTEHYPRSLISTPTEVFTTQVSVAKSKKSQRASLDPMLSIESYETKSASLKQEEDDLAKKEEEAAKLKEKRRLEEMAKAKDAEERKRRLAEKAKAKAAVRTQKEAARKEKERLKRASKKEAAAAKTSIQDDISSLSGSVQIGTTEDSDSSPVIEAKDLKHIVPKTAVLHRKKLISHKANSRSVSVSAKRDRKGSWMWILLLVLFCSSLLFLSLLSRLYF